MSDRRDFEAQLKQNEQVQPLQVDIDKLANHIANVSKIVCDALVKRGFSEEAAVYLAAQIVPHIT